MLTLNDTLRLFPIPTFTFCLALASHFDLQAATSILSDSFDSEKPALNYNEFTDWKVQFGSVDTIKSGTYDIVCHGNKGICIDLDGTTNNAGQLVSKLKFLPGVYRLTYWLSGNQQPSGYGPDKVTVTFGTFSHSVTLPNEAPFKQYTHEIRLFTRSDLVFHNDGGDTGGAILDDVEVTFLREFTREDYYESEYHEKLKKIRNKRNSLVIGDPIDTSTGELILDESPDMERLDGPVPLTFRRYYASRLGDVLSGLGTNWSHNFNWQLLANETFATIISPRGTLFDFEQVDGVWQLLAGNTIRYQLIPIDEDEVAFLDPSEGIIRTFRQGNPGRLVRTEDANGNSLNLNYDAEGQLSSIQDGKGRSFQFEFNANGNLIAITDPERRVGYGYTERGELASVTDFSGRVTDFSYDEAFPGEAKLQTLRRPAGTRPIHQTYLTEPGPFQGWIASQTDAAGNETQVSYSENDAGLITTIVDPLGLTTEHYYNSNGAIISVTDPSDLLNENKPAISMRYGNPDAPTELTDRLGGKHGFSYDHDSGFLNELIHTNDAKTSFQYSKRSKDGFNYYDLSQVTHADETSESIEYDAHGNVLSMTDTYGNESKWAYNTEGQVTEAINPLGGSQTYTYDPTGRLLQEEQETGYRVQYEYDSLGRVIAHAFEDETGVHYTYNLQNDITSITDELGRLTRLVYDLNGNLSAVSNPMDETTAFTYDANERVTSVMDALGHSSTFQYDAHGRLTTFTDAQTNSTTYSFDGLGRLTRIQDTLGNAWSATYDAEGFQTSFANPEGDVIEYFSDALGRTIGVKSPLGHLSRFTYDGRGHLTSIVNPDSNGTRLIHDSEGRLLSESLLDEEHGVSFERNGLGEVTAFVDVEGNTWRFDYDSMGKVLSFEDPLERKESYVYDARNRLAGVEYPGGLGSLQFDYDVAGQLIRVKDSTGMTDSFSYDDAGRLLETTGIKREYDGAGRMIESNGISLGYDANNQLKSLQFTSEFRIEYIYDAIGNVIAVKDWLGGETRFEYDSAARMVKMVRPNGTVREQTFDKDSRLIGIKEGTMFSIQLKRDPVGRIVSENHQGLLEPNWEHLPDFAADFDESSQVLGARYDALGRMIEMGEDTYTWNVSSRLIKYVRDHQFVVSTYDAGGLKQSRSTSSGLREYVWNEALSLPSLSIERQHSKDVRYYIHTPDGELLYAIEAETGARYFFHFDESGNTKCVTDDQGAKKVTYCHSPFGILTNQEGHWDNPFTWQGELGVMSEGDDLYYIRDRHYDARTASFLSRDVSLEMGLPSQSPYQYAFGNPLSWADVDGASPRKSKNNKGIDPKSFNRKKLSELTAREALAKLRTVQHRLKANKQKMKREERNLSELERRSENIRKKINVVLDAWKSAGAEGLQASGAIPKPVKTILLQMESRTSSLLIKQQNQSYNIKQTQFKIRTLESDEEKLKQHLKRLPGNLN